MKDLSYHIQSIGSLDLEKIKPSTPATMMYFLLPISLSDITKLDSLTYVLALRESPPIFCCQMSFIGSYTSSSVSL